MAIVAEIQVTVAEVEVIDDYRVGLRVRSKRTDYSVDEAVQLADELVAAAVAVQRTVAEDTAARAATVHLVSEGSGLTACCSRAPFVLPLSDRVTSDADAATCGQFGFDVDGPLHPECRVGKCGNCDGVTLDGRDEWVRCSHSCHAEEVAS